MRGLLIFAGVWALLAGAFGWALFWFWLAWVLGDNR